MSIFTDAKKLSANDWHLYSPMPGIKTAARELSKALSQGMLMESAKEAWAHVSSVMYKHRALGASDTEPRGVARDYLEKAFPYSSDV